MVAILGEGIALTDVFGAVVSSERWLVEGDVADQIEGIEVFADFFGERIKMESFFGEFVDDGLLALGVVPSGEEVFEGGEVLLEGFLGEVL